MKKWLLILALALLTGAALLFLRVGQTGESRVESWVGDQLKSIVHSGGKYTLDFDSIDYRSPNRVVLGHLKLSFDDPSGRTAPLIEIETGTVDLAEVPRWGKPIVIDSVMLARPVVHIDALIASSRRKQSTSRPSTRTSLSHVLTLRQIEIMDGSLIYDDGKGSPLSWTELNAKLHLEHVDPKWHRARLTIDQSPLVTANLSAEIDLDSMIARNVDVSAALNLNDPASTKFFTPPLQRLISKYEVRGHLDLRVTGIANGLQRELTKLDLSLELADGNVSIGEYHLPVDGLSAVGRVYDNELVIDKTQARMLSGTIDGQAQVRLVGDKRFDGQIIASKLRLDQLLKSRSDNARTELAGLVGADIRIKSTTPDLRLIARGETDGVGWGSGYVQITEGRLVRLPVISQMIRATRTVSELFTGDGTNHDSFEAQFQLIDKIADIREMLYRGDGIGMRGKGRIAFNGEVDLQLNAGPLERIQETLGPIGRIWGELTDQLMNYSVKGTLKSPVVKPLLGPG